VIWMDQKKARLFEKTRSGLKEEVIVSPLEKRVRIEGEKADRTRFGSSYFSNNEDRKNNKEETNTLKYFKLLESHIKQQDAIGLIGPGMHRVKFYNYLVEKNAFKNKRYIMESTNKLTENQLLSKVKNLLGS